MVMTADAVVAILTLSSYVCLSSQVLTVMRGGKKCVNVSSCTQYTCTESLLYAKHCSRYCRYKDEQDTQFLPQGAQSFECGLLQYDLVSSILIGTKA